MKKELRMQTFVLLGCFLVTQADVCLPPKITKQPIAEFIYELNSPDLKMTCEAEGVPEVEYSWKKNHIDFELNNQNIRPDPKTGSFTFKELYASDAGYYQCFAKNQYGMAVSQISSLQQTLLGSFPTQPDPMEYEVNHGDKLTLKCNAPNSFPVPTYRWALADSMADKKPAAIVENQRIMWDLNGDLHIANVEPDDSQGGRIYMCKVYNPNSRTEKSGSESKIFVNQGSPNATGPVLMFGPKPTVVALVGEILTIQCIFSGFPTPDVKFTRVGKPMPYPKYDSEKSGTVVKIKDIQEADSGTYKCTGQNTQGEKEHEFSVDVQMKPYFVESEDNKPHNINMTEGKNAVFKCTVEGEPKAVVQWFKNGVPINSADPGPRMHLSEDGMKLTIKDLCKTCSNGQTDLMVIQCNASNVHGYVFAEGYLNVLLKTVLVEKPQNINVSAWEDEVMFPCIAESDDSTPVKITWYFDDTEIDPSSKAYKILPNGLLVNTVLLDNEEKDKAAGKYTCVARNGLSSESAEAYLMLISHPVINATVPAVATIITESSISWLLIIIIIVAGSLLLIVLLLVCCLCTHRKNGDEYQVDEKEKKFGLNPEKELADNGFHEYQRLEVRPFMGSQASLSSRMNLSDSGNKGSLIVYTEPDNGKIN